MQKPKEGSQKIRVFLNGEELETFRGMKVKHILPFATIRAISNGELMVTDEEGHERGLEGSLADGEHLKIRPIGKSP
jgi:hypothetical protein